MLNLWTSVSVLLVECLVELLEAIQLRLQFTLRQYQSGYSEVVGVWVLSESTTRH
jgi:hypothetical protein